MLTTHHTGCINRPSVPPSLRPFGILYAVVVYYLSTLTAVEAVEAMESSTSTSAGKNQVEQASPAVPSLSPQCHHPDHPDHPVPSLVVSHCIPLYPGLSRFTLQPYWRDRDCYLRSALLLGVTPRYPDRDWLSFLSAPYIWYIS